MKFVTKQKLRQGMDFLKELSLKEEFGVGELKPGYHRQVRRRKWTRAVFGAALNAIRIAHHPDKQERKKVQTFDVRGYENLRKLRAIRLKEVIADMARPGKNLVKELDEEVVYKDVKLTKIHA